MTKAKQEDGWRSRIVGHGVADAKKLRENPANWRTHPDFQHQALTAVLERVGWVQTVIVNKRTGRLVDGHLRVHLSAKKGERRVPVTYVDLTEEEEALVLATLDPIAGLALPDKTKIGDLLASLETDSEDLEALFNDLRKQSGVDQYVPKTIEELAAEAGPIEPSQLWPVFSVRLPPKTFQRAQDALSAQKGDTPEEKFAALLDAAEKRR